MIGNPPYVEAKKLKYIASTLKQRYNIYSGTADLSIYFLELAFNLLSLKGLVYYITTNKFFNTQYGQKVRQLLSIKQIHTILNFEQVEVFEDILVSSVILGVQNIQTMLDNMLTYERFYKLKYSEFKVDFSSRLNNLGCYPQKYLDSEEWSFADISGLLLRNHIRKDSQLLSNIEGIEIYRGVTTGYNPAFIISNNQKDELISQDIHNSDIIKNMLQGRNIRRWYYNESDENLIFIPWHFPLHADSNIKGASSDAEKRFLEGYPSLYAHVLGYKSKLCERNKDETGISYEWYALQRCAASYYNEFEKTEKIIWGLTADKWAFAFDNKKHYLPSNGYILTSKEIPIKYILGILNSKLMRHYFSYIGIMTAGGAYTLKAATIEALPFKTSINYKPIINLVDNILALKNSNPDNDTSILESEIDKLVYKLYGLTDDEIKIIEGE